MSFLIEGNEWMANQQRQWVAIQEFLEAVTKATLALKADYERRMEAMAAEYEAKIAELQPP